MNKPNLNPKPEVLVLDPQSRVRDRLEEILHDIIQISVAETPEEAIRILKEHSISVVVTDQRWMKEGQDLLLEVHEVSPATRVILTGLSNPDEVVRAVDRGHIYAYLAKPWEPLELRLTITQAAAHYELVKELNLEKLHFQQLMDNIPDVIYFKDSSRRFTRVNKAKAALVGVDDPAELIGKGDWQFFSADEASRIQAEDDTVLLRGRAVTDQHHCFTPPDGKQRWFSTSKAQLSEEMGGGLVGLSRDITARRLAEDRLKEVVPKLVAAEKEKREFCAQVVLAVTGGALHLVEAYEIPQLVDAAFDYDLEDPKSYGLIREALRDMGPRANLNDEEVEDIVLAAGEAITNAIKHARKGRCQAAVQGDAVIVRVTDQGEGIDPDALPDTLFRAGFSTKVSLGLGYTLVLKLVNEMWLATGHDGTVLQLVRRRPCPLTDEAALQALLDRF